MAQALFESAGDPDASTRVEFIGYPVRTECCGCGTFLLILIAIFVWPLGLLWLAFRALTARKDSWRLTIAPTEISWGKAGSRDGQVSIALAQIDHIEVHRRGPVPWRIVLVPKSGPPTTVPDEFLGRSAQGILAELHQSLAVREVDLPEREVARRDEVDALAAKARARGEREEMPNGVRWLARPARGALLFWALIVAATYVLLNVGVFSKNGDDAAAISILLTLVLAPLFIGLIRAAFRDPLELHVTMGGISCGRPSEPDLWERIRAKDLEAVHWSEIEGDEGGRFWQLVFKTVQGDYVELQSFTLCDYGADICHVASTLHPHLKLALANLPRNTHCRSWPRKNR